MTQLRLAPLVMSLVATGLAGAPAPAQDRIGVTAAVNRDAAVERDTTRQSIVLGDDVVFRDRVETDANGLVQMLFTDGSAFTVGSNSSVTVDEFVYNPATDSGSLVSEVTRGALRFVGGRLSKGDDPVRFRTPVGTLGVRGAIVEIDLEPACLADGRCPAMTATLLFGRDLTLDLPDGRRQRIREPGHAFVVFEPEDAGGPRVETEVRIVEVRFLDQGDLQRRLEGQPGQRGGARLGPTDAAVAGSGLPEVNSGLAPVFLLPRPPREVVATTHGPDPDIPGLGGPILAIERDVLEPAQAEAIRQAVIVDEDSESRRTPSAVQVTPIFGYTTENGAAEVEFPAMQGINVPDTDEFLSVAVIESTPGVPVALEVQDLTFSYPTFEGEFDILDVQSTEFIPGTTSTISGTILRGPSGFALYHLNVDPLAPGDDATVFILAGTPTARSVFYPGENARPAIVRTYTFQEDYQRSTQGISSAVPLLNPLVALEFGNDFLEQVTTTPFYVIERQDVQRSAATLHASMRIDGVGLDQRSMIVSDAGFVFGSIAGSGADALGIGGTRRGSLRFGAGETTLFMRGGTGSIQVSNAVIDTAILGADGEAFVYSSGIDIGLARNSAGDEREFIDVTVGDPLRAPTDGLRYSSVYLPAFLTGSEALTSFDRPTIRTLGFAAGMVESQDGSVTPFRSGGPGDVQMEFDTTRPTLGGLITVRDVTAGSSANQFRYAFGFDITGTFDNASNDRSSYLDWNRFAANSTGPGNAQGGDTTLLVTDLGATIRHQPFDPVTGEGADPGTYVVSSGLVPQTEFFAASGVTPCTCEFMQWGWWGSQTEFVDPSLPGGVRRDVVHLGTWAIGDIPVAGDLPTVGTGSYTGHAVGNVSVEAGGGTSQYVAVGDMSLNYDFAARSGLLEIDNFDGRNFGGTVNDPSLAGSVNTFFGALNGSGLTGNAVGSFASGPDSVAQGVLGSFDVNDGAFYTATGTFLGELP